MNQLRSQIGFSLIEVSIVVMLAFAAAGMAVLNISSILPGMRANEAMHQTMAQLREARELSVAERRNIVISFLNDNQIQTERINPTGGNTILRTVTLNDGYEFHLFSGVPDTPDAFGNGSALNFGGLTSLTCMTDGSLSDDRGNPLTGSIFLGLPDHPDTARAVTVLGATGRIRSYRWTGAEWIQ